MNEENEMEHFDKRQALEVIEDALTNIGSAHGRGMVVGLCGAFYMCGLLNKDEWEALLARIPIEDDYGDASQTTLQDNTKH